MPADSQTWLAKILIACVRPLVRLFYKVRIAGLENLPREGGVLVASDHFSYVDVVLLVVASPRPLRTLAWGGFTRYAFFRAIFRVFGTLPISPDNARASLKDAARLLEEGAAILIFPEGQISRTGELQQIEGGFNLLARHSGKPVVPVHLAGVWGSIFSFERGKFFWKWPLRLPYPVVLRFGPPIPADAATVQNLRQALVALAQPSDPVNAPLAIPPPPPAVAPAAPAPAAPPAPPRQPPGAPLLDLDEAKFIERPEFAGHLGEALVRALKGYGGGAAIVDYTTDHAQRIGPVKLLALALALAQRLRREVPEPRVGIVLPPGFGGLVANFAVMLAGKTPVNLNFTIGKGALEHSLRKAGIKTTITDKTFREKITTRLPDLPFSERVLNLRDEIAALSKLKLLGWLLAAKFCSANLLLRLGRVPREGGDREAGLLFTSGSSGEPKGVVLTHRNILGNCAQIDASGILPAHEVLLANLPIFHSFGFTINLWYAIQRGLRVVTVPSPLDVHKCLDAIAAEKATVLLGTPTFFRAYLKRAEPRQLASVKFVVAGAEKTPAGFHEEWEKHFGSQYCEGYGLTETSPVVAVNLPAQPGESAESVRLKKRLGSVGKLFPGSAARIVDPDTGADKGFNDVGILWLKGVNIFPGYLEQPEATAAAFNTGWFVTGDLAKLDEDGFLYIEGRLSRFSKIGGEMVPHGTVEAAVAEALGLSPGDAASHVAIAARPDAAKGEALVLLTTMDIKADELRGKLSAKGLANLWIPRIIKKVDAIPVLGTGKLDLKKLKEMAKE
jgi:acyl-[acyl-carrier-protein]-phospholipid O-acyltransferase / long-chain-fatty-acid--[acyl-carrier-protein] ligase